MRWELKDVGSLSGRSGYGFVMLDAGLFVAEFTFETEDEARRARALMSQAIENAIETPMWSLTGAT